MEEFLKLLLTNAPTILVFLVGGVVLINSLKKDVKFQSVRLAAIESEMSELRKVVIELARQEERIQSMDQRLLAHGKRVDAQGERITAIDQRVNELLVRNDRWQENFQKKNL